MKKNYKDKFSDLPNLKKIVIFFVLVCFSLTNAMAQTTTPKVSLNEKESNFSKVAEKLKKQTDYEFVFNSADVTSLNQITINLRNVTLKEALDQILKDKPVTYTINDKTVVIKKVTQVKNTQNKGTRITVTGKVVDKSTNKPIAGATIIVLGTNVGAISDDKGAFSLIAFPNDKLEVAFLGMKSVVYDKTLTDKSNVIIVMESDVMAMDNVVVTGFFNKNKNSFTGSVKTLNVEELKSVSNTNLISAIAMMTPGLRMVENNQFGSDPNRIPEIVIRGTSTLSTDADESANQPVIILDGVEITMRDLYDIDMNDIERVDVLKDASATALYGEKAANGVIVIERKPILSDKLRLTYNLDASIDVPDLNTYNYLNAKDKLEFERLAKLYDFNVADDYEEYNRKYKLIAKGLDTDWLSKPLRGGYTLNNSVGVSGRGNNMTYRVNANIKNQRGVMKDDYRDNYALSTFLSYHVADKITVSYQNSFTNTKSKNSPYGVFEDYIRVNPYDSPYDAYGKLVKILSWDELNPLYEASVGNFNKSNSLQFSNTLKVRWYILKNLFVTAQGDITTYKESKDDYLSPNSAKFVKEPDLNKKGRLIKSERSSRDLSGKFVLNYSKPFGDNGTILTVNVGGDIKYSQSLSHGYTTMGYNKDNLFTPNFSSGYETNPKYKPQGKEELLARLGLLGSVNFILKNRYFVDGSFRRSGSSQFGSNNKYAPFWSVGTGWNLHNENFAKDSKWLTTARIRYSYGVTGSVEFSPYQAITTYNYSSDYFYLHGVGAVPLGMGNNDLTWQNTNMHNIGVNIDLWDGRISLTLDYYRKLTEDMLIDLTIPPSVGQSTIKANLGEMLNNGFEFDLSATIFRTKDWRLTAKFNGAINNNKILSISNALSNYNKESNEEETVAPKLLFKENQSTTAIYAVRSAGINPATGQEVFINRFGQYTLTYDSEDKVVVGDATPYLEGAILPSLSYKNFSLTVAMMYRFGGHVYNETRAANVENVNPKHNVDQRAFDERWKNINDVPLYLDIANSESRTGIHTSRFVEKDNTLEIKRIELAYQFNSDLLSKIGFKRLRISVAANDPFRLSTVRYERGTSYPFSRGFSFSISPTF